MERTPEAKIVDEIFQDLFTRRGLKQSWEGIDPDTQAEIRSSCEARGREILSGTPEETSPKTSGSYWAVYIDEDDEVQVNVIRCIHEDWGRAEPCGPMIAADSSQRLELLGPRVPDWSPPNGLVEQIEQRLIAEVEEREERLVELIQSMDDDS